MAASAMYKMKPIYGNSDMVDECSTSMYKMKNIHEDTADEMAIDQYPELLGIQNRQEAVLKELEKLKNEVDQIGVDIGMDSPSKPTKVPSDKQAPAIHEAPTMYEAPTCNFVINASPDNPPLSVILLYRMIHERGLRCSMVSHVHSSWTGQVPNKLNKLFHTSSSSVICFRVIWKSDILAPSLINSLANQSPILGEINILRYLARTFDRGVSYNDKQPLLTSTVDDWLSAASKLTSPKDGKTFIQNLNTHLGINQTGWISDRILSIADLYCSVALLKNNPGGQFPTNVSKWMAQCRKWFPGFEEVENYYE